MSEREILASKSLETTVVVRSCPMLPHAYRDMKNIEDSDKYVSTLELHHDTDCILLYLFTYFLMVGIAKCLNTTLFNLKTLNCNSG